MADESVSGRANRDLCEASDAGGEEQNIELLVNTRLVDINLEDSRLRLAALEYIV